MKKKIFGIVGVVVIMILALVVWNNKSGIYTKYITFKMQNSPMEKCEFHISDTSDFMHDNRFFIAHGGGAINGLTYTNSREALEKSLKNGYKFIEIDLMKSIEGVIFGAHDYKHFDKITGVENPILKELESKNGGKISENDERLAPKISDVKRRKIHKIYTPLDINDINEIFARHPHAYLVSDKLNDFSAMKTQIKFMDRVLVEVFGLQNYYAAKKAGIKYPMLSTGDFNLALNLKIPMVAAHTSAIKNAPKEAENYIKAGGCIMVFSSNEEKFIGENLGKRASMFYTDFWDLKSGKCEGKSCKTY
ncbi:hypothetical protein CCY99_03880 [Helicobacter sp. 16-1353]|uniref:hypothetical protein n=1 Tax=Helicobacter sp. 16-1353 TaxID=2004996 RepID=UPI000DCC3979|nr:hypothetical protein [Helicobacter sp. 16-1353]RAX54497.1 hypothetical protein CCY99_03880 [Helicobacter sp. 16-1353]